MAIGIPPELLRRRAACKRPAGVLGDPAYRGPRDVQSLPLTSRTSSQPSPSKSRKAAPDPSVSGRYLWPERPLLCTEVNAGRGGDVREHDRCGRRAETDRREQQPRSPRASSRGAHARRHERYAFVLVNRLPLVVVFSDLGSTYGNLDRWTDAVPALERAVALR